LVKLGTVIHVTVVQHSIAGQMLFCKLKATALVGDYPISKSFKAYVRRLVLILQLILVFLQTLNAISIGHPPPIPQTEIMHGL